jgi:PPE-repeat protein
MKMNIKERISKLLSEKSRGQFGQMQGLVVGIITVLAFVGLGLILMAQLKTQAVALVTDNTTQGQVNTTFDTGTTLIAGIPGWVSIAFVVVMIVIVIGLLGYLAVGRGNKRG